MRWDPIWGPHCAPAVPLPSQLPTYDLGKSKMMGYPLAKQQPRAAALKDIRGCIDNSDSSGGVRLEGWPGCVLPQGNQARPQRLTLFVLAPKQGPWLIYKLQRIGKGLSGKFGILFLRRYVKWEKTS